VALQHPALAAEQLEDAVKRLGLRGTLIGGSVNGEELSDPRFHPFWAKAEELGVVVFIHPQGVTELAGRLKGNGVLANVIGNPLETTIALSHLIFEGTLDRFPGVQDPCCSWRRLSALLCRAVGRRLRDLPRPLHQAVEVAAKPISATALLRFDGVYAGRPASLGS
jgi:Amidohydrolase